MWEKWMRRALELAALAEGRTSPNPLVGALVLDQNGRLVGEGFHSRAGEPHAEVGALAQAGRPRAAEPWWSPLNPVATTAAPPLAVKP